MSDRPDDSATRLLAALAAVTAQAKRLYLKDGDTALFRDRVKLGLALAKALNKLLDAAELATATQASAAGRLAEEWIARARK